MHPFNIYLTPVVYLNIYFIEHQACLPNGSNFHNVSLPERTAEDPMHCLQEHAPPREDSQIKCAHACMHRHISHTHIHMDKHTYMQCIHSHMHTHSHNHVIPPHNTCIHIQHSNTHAHTTLKHTCTSIHTTLKHTCIYIHILTHIHM